MAGRPAWARVTLKAMTDGMTLQSGAFAGGESIPRRFSCEGEDLSPPLSWSEPPPGTKSLVLICADPDAPAGTFSHWGLYDLPAETRELGEGASKSGVAGAKQAVNDFGKPGYRGPCPPKGHGIHHYVFELFALDVAKLDVPDGAGVQAVKRAAAAHALARAELVGIYQR